MENPGDGKAVYDKNVCRVFGTCQNGLGWGSGMVRGRSAQTTTATLSPLLFDQRF